MKVALTIWEDRISPVFDAARCLLIAEIRNEQIHTNEKVQFKKNNLQAMIDSLLKHDVSVLICGAISHCPAKMIEDRSIELISFVSGNYEDILKVYAAGEPLAPKYVMPGCKGGCRRVRGLKIQTHSPESKTL